MSASFYDIMKYAKTGIASPEMTYYDRLKASALFGGTAPDKTITGIPPITLTARKADAASAYKLTGKTVQNGTPTPDAPIEIKGVGDRTENLFDPDVLLEAVDWEKNDNIYSGYSSSLHNKFNSFDNCVPVDAAVVSMSVMFRYANLNTPFFIVFWYTDGTKEQFSKNGKAGEWAYLSCKSDSDKTLKGIAFSYGTNDLVELKEIMLNLGSTAIPYEPYGYCITLEVE